MEHQLDSDTVATLRFVSEQGEPFTIDLVKELSLSDATFEEDVEKQPGKYAWWASVLERTRQKARAKEDELEYTHATLSNEARKVLDKPTVASIESYVKVNDNYVETLHELRFWQGRVDMLVYIVKSFEQRERMLMQKGAQLRKSLDNERTR
jgi:hypothetical protein